MGSTSLSCFLPLPWTRSHPDIKRSYPKASRGTARSGFQWWEVGAFTTAQFINRTPAIKELIIYLSKYFLSDKPYGHNYFVGCLNYCCIWPIKGIIEWRHNIKTLNLRSTQESITSTETPSISIAQKHQEENYHHAKRTVCKPIMDLKAKSFHCRQIEGWGKLTQHVIQSKSCSAVGYDRV